ncbi:fasciclin domain-containing protein [Planctomycetaceae bacterium SH139]
MKNFFGLTAHVLLASVFVVGCSGETETTGDVTTSGTSDTEVTSIDSPDEMADIVDTAAGAGDFGTLVAAVKAAGLVETLKGDGPFTVFAPTDAAFEDLPEGTVADLLKPENKDKLVAILTYHVVPGKVMAADVVKLDSATTVQGKDVAVTVEGETVMINGAKVVAADIECSNGVVHAIDAVIMPPSE